MYSISRCEKVPLPAVPKLYLSGSFRASASSSAMLLAGTLLLASSTCGTIAMPETGSKSAIGSKPGLL